MIFFSGRATAGRMVIMAGKVSFVFLLAPALPINSAVVFSHQRRQSSVDLIKNARRKARIQIDSSVVNQDAQTYRRKLVVHHSERMPPIGTLIFFLVIDAASTYTKVSTDYDRYGIKIDINDRFLVSVDNILSLWWIELIPHTSGSNCTVSFNLTTCDFVYSVTVSLANNRSFVYNCIDPQGNNVVGHIRSNDTFAFELLDEQIVSNYSTQDNFVIDMNSHSTGVYGFADDFVFFYELHPVHRLIVWANTLGVSPRAVDTSADYEYGALVGYCQLTVATADECGFVVRLNASGSCPVHAGQFDIADVLQYPWSDPRSVRYTPQGRVYTDQSVMSVAIAWHTQRVLIGIPSVNTVLLYSLNGSRALLGSRDNGGTSMGYGKSVSWLDSTGSKAVILANTHSYTTYQWISSVIQLFDIQSDGFSDATQPISIYPNSQQVLQSLMDPTFIRVVCSSTGNLGVLDRLGNAMGILSAPPGTYSNTNTSIYITDTMPCGRGTSRDYDGIELCYPHSSSSYNCSEDTFCPYGAVGEVDYSVFESIEQDQEYPESPENVVFDDLLMQNMFLVDFRSVHCLVVSPITWVLLVIVIGGTISILMAVSEWFCPHHHLMRNRVKGVFKKMDLISEGKMWVGGLTSAAIIVLIVSACSFSNAYFQQYPIEHVTKDSSFACDVTLRNAKFSTTTQKRWDSRHSTKESQPIFDLLNSQPFTLNIDLVQTALTCDDDFYVQRLNGYKVTVLPITTCMMNYNDTALSLAVSLPVHEISVQLILPGLKTVGAIRIGLSGPSGTIENERFTLLELKFASTFVSPTFDQVLAESIVFPIELTQIVNQTDPLNTDGSPTFSGIWSSSFSVNSDELFTNESRYTFFYRTQTNISIMIKESIFFISHLQEPIARRVEIIFRSLLFTTVVLEVFGLVFLLIKLLLIPMFRTIARRIRRSWPRKSVAPTDKLDILVVKNSQPPNGSDSTCVKNEARRRWSTPVNAP